MQENRIQTINQGHFTTKFIPEMILDDNKQCYLALDHISMTYSWHNIAPNYNNNELKISKDKVKHIKQVLLFQKRMIIKI